ncbi:MAG: tripartite tricarboxylate transporter substrate binding protein [Rhodospirillales bacterium]|nr:tripartite tricarboxylate transporter substrate binding protein [Rhodospirillales bacterium]
MRPITMRRLARISLLIAAAVAIAAPVVAQQYPARTVKIVVPFGPGGPADIYARVLGHELSEILKQSFVVENKPGAGGTIGADVVAKAAPDGHTLLMMSNTLTTNETLLTKKPYALMRDLTAVAPVNSSDLVMAVSPSLPAKTVQELIAYAKANPGKLSYASAGPGTPYNLAGELFKTMTGTDILHVPYKNSGDARSAVIGGHVQIMFDAVTAMKGQIDAGQVRALATTGLTRSAVLPNVPTVNEAGVPGYEATIWLGIMAPTGTPKEIIDRLNLEIGKIIARPAIREAWAKQGAVPMTMTPAAFATFLKGDIDKWAKVIEKAGLKVQ